MAIRYGSIAETDLERWYDHVGGVFSKAGRQYFINHYRNDPWALAGGILVAEDLDAPGPDGQPLIVSTVRVFDRRLLIRGREVSCGGIGEVSTKPEYRRQGHSGRLLTMAADLMAARGMPLSLLFTDRFGHYGRYGWRQIKLPLVAATPRPGVTVDRAGTAFRPVDFARDLDLMMAAYRDLNARASGATVRDSRAYWERWVSSEMGDQGRIFLADGQPAGFGRFGRRAGALRVYDLGILAAHAALLPVFLGAQAEEAGLPLRLHRTLYRLAPDAFDARFHVTPLPPVDDQMFRLIDGTAFLRAVFADAVSALPDGARIVLRYESGASTICSAGGRLAVAAGATADAADSLTLTDAQLLGLVLVGWDYLPEVGCELPAATAECIAALRRIFTPAGWLFWAEDGF